ncbi:MAG: DMT family transporter [Chromatiales bacterium]|jgi:drug/metabolite transporter (DMT)-like permease|nr:DMT family transporter [Chromatiales bacterium]PLX56696.1 MAG: EamA/RhaT family transporter [Chromatiales bacterium]
MPDLPKQTHQEHVVRGMLAAMAAFFMFTVMNVFAKLLSVRHSVFEIAFYRNLIACMPFLFMVFVLGKREILVIRSKPTLVGFRAVLGALSLVTTFAAFSLMPMAETTVLLFTSSLFIPMLGVFFLGERVGPYRWAAVAIGFAGVLIMAGPGGHMNALGITVAIAAALMHATLQIVLRYLGRYERPETITFYFLIIGALVMALPLPLVAVTPTLAEVPLLFGVGLSGALAQWLLTIAFRNAPAAIVTVFNYSGIVWATFFGWLIWNDWPLPQVLVGATVVILSNGLIIWRESRARKITGARVRAEF